MSSRSDVDTQFHDAAKSQRSGNNWSYVTADKTSAFRSTFDDAPHSKSSEFKQTPRTEPQNLDAEQKMVIEKNSPVFTTTEATDPGDSTTSGYLSPATPSTGAILQEPEVLPVTSGWFDDDDLPPPRAVETIAVYHDEPVYLQCPVCNHKVTTLVRHKNGMLVWVSAGVILLCGCWLLCCLIPFTLDGLKDKDHYCPVCLSHLGRKHMI